MSTGHCCAAVSVHVEVYKPTAGGCAIPLRKVLEGWGQEAEPEEGAEREKKSA